MTAYQDLEINAKRKGLVYKKVLLGQITPYVLLVTRYFFIASLLSKAHP